ncbi:MAG: YihY/virulence factor BrkB family protein, partial [Chitinophagaceae bacterium]
LIANLDANRLNVRAAAVTYNLLMAIPPSLLFFCSLIPYLPLHGAEQSILTILRVLTPNEKSYESLQTIVTDFLHQERRDILSFGLLSTFFFSSNGIMGLMRSFDRHQDLYVKRSGIKRRWTAIKLTAIVLVVGLLTIAALIIQSNYINGILRNFMGNIVLIKALTMGIIIVMIFLVICMIYTYGPSLSRRFAFFSPGAIVAIILCVLLTIVFFALVKNVIHYNKVYGSIGTLMAFMAWLFLNIQVVLLGFELNLSILTSHESTRK